MGVSITTFTPLIVTTRVLFTLLEIYSLMNAIISTLRLIVMLLDKNYYGARLPCLLFVSSCSLLTFFYKVSNYLKISFLCWQILHASCNGIMSLRGDVKAYINYYFLFFIRVELSFYLISCFVLLLYILLSSHCNCY